MVVCTGLREPVSGKNSLENPANLYRMQGFFGLFGCRKTDCSGTTAGERLFFSCAHWPGPAIVQGNAPSHAGNCTTPATNCLGAPRTWT